MKTAEHTLIEEAGLEVVVVERLKYWLANYMYPDCLHDKIFEVHFLGIEHDEVNRNNDLGLICFKFESGENLYPKFPMRLYYDFKLACDLDGRMTGLLSNRTDEKRLRQALRQPEDSYKRASHGTFLEPDSVEGIYLKGRYGYDHHYKDGKWALMDRDGVPVTDYKYWFIEPCGEGYFRAQVTGSKYNLLRPDGTEIFSVPYHYISNVHNGFAICSITKAKTKTTPTQYLHGLLHVSGDIVFPLVFPAMHWVCEKHKDNYGFTSSLASYIYAEIDKQIYVIDLNGCITNLQLNHLPPRKDGKERFDIVRTGCRELCKECVYSHLITQEGKKCGRLNTDDFRYNIIKGVCSYKKKSLLELSEFEENEIRYQKEKQITQQKRAGGYAYDLVKSFIDEVLESDISRICSFDFNQLKNDAKYHKFISDRDVSENIDRMAIVRALLIVLWGEAWPDCTYEQIEHYKYFKDDVLSFFQMFFAGIDIGEGLVYAKAEKVFSFSKELKRQVHDIWPRFHSLANMVLLPTGITRAAVENSITRSKRMWREYPDGFLTMWKEAILHTSSQPWSIQDCIKPGKKAYVNIKTEEDFNETMKKLMLDDFIGEDGSIPQVFDHIYVGQKFLKPEEYFPCVERYLDLSNQFFDKRERRIIEKLKTLYDME